MTSKAASTDSVAVVAAAVLLLLLFDSNGFTESGIVSGERIRPLSESSIPVALRLMRLRFANSAGVVELMVMVTEGGVSGVEGCSGVDFLKSLLLLSLLFTVAGSISILGSPSVLFRLSLVGSFIVYVVVVSLSAALDDVSVAVLLDAAFSFSSAGVVVGADVLVVVVVAVLSEGNDVFDSFAA